MPSDPRDHQEPDPEIDVLPFEEIDDYDGRTTCGLLEED